MAALPIDQLRAEIAKGQPVPPLVQGPSEGAPRKCCSTSPPR